jgi:2-oxoisovalerate dehydrogenase E2 component (dihydrolipoyl transacylase)
LLRVELTSPATGKIRKLRAKPGETIHVGETLCEIDVGGEAEAGVDADAAQETEAQPSSSQHTESRDGGTATQTQSAAVSGVESSTTPTAPLSHDSSASRVKVEETSYETSELEHSLLQNQDSAMESAGGGRFSGEGAILPSAPRSHHPLAPEEIVQRMARTVADGERKIAKASPAVRTLAAKLGVRLEDVRPTGEAGRVTRDDVRAAAEGGALSDSGRQVGRSSETVSERRQGPRDAVPAITRVEFGRTRKVMYRAMGDMGAVPHFG